MDKEEFQGSWLEGQSELLPLEPYHCGVRASDLLSTGEFGLIFSLNHTQSIQGYTQHEDSTSRDSTSRDSFSLLGHHVPLGGI